jgi:hypothetical protein
MTGRMDARCAGLERHDSMHGGRFTVNPVLVLPKAFKDIGGTNPAFPDKRSVQTVIAVFFESRQEGL